MCRVDEVESKKVLFETGGKTVVDLSKRFVRARLSRSSVAAQTGKFFLTFFFFFFFCRPHKYSDEELPAPVDNDAPALPIDVCLCCFNLLLLQCYC
jgi:hypothetical protein